MRSRFLRAPESLREPQRVKRFSDSQEGEAENRPALPFTCSQDRVSHDEIRGLAFSKVELDQRSGTLSGSPCASPCYAKRKNHRENKETSSPRGSTFRERQRAPESRRECLGLPESVYILSESP